MSLLILSLFFTFNKSICFEITQLLNEPYFSNDFIEKYKFYDKKYKEYPILQKVDLFGSKALNLILTNYLNNNYNSTNTFSPLDKNLNDIFISNNQSNINPFSKYLLQVSIGIKDYKFVNDIQGFTDLSHYSFIKSPIFINKHFSIFQRIQKDINSEIEKLENLSKKLIEALGSGNLTLLCTVSIKIIESKMTLTKVYLIECERFFLSLSNSKDNITIKDIRKLNTIKYINIWQKEVCNITRTYNLLVLYFNYLNLLLTVVLVEKSKIDDSLENIIKKSKDLNLFIKSSINNILEQYRTSSIYMFIDPKIYHQDLQDIENIFKKALQ